MHCLACGRPLTKFSVSYPTRDGVVGYGPRCGRKFMVRKERGRAVVVRRRGRPDDRQMDWIGP